MALFFYLFIWGFNITVNTVKVVSRTFVGRRDLYIQFAKFLYCTLLIISKELGLELLTSGWEASVLPLYHRGSPALIIHNPEITDI